MPPVAVFKNVQPAEEYVLTPADAGQVWFETVFREHYPRIVALLARLTGDRGQAEELAADAFSKLSRRPVLRAGEGGVAPWLYRVAMNAGLDAVRSNSRRKRREEWASTSDRADSSTALDDMLREEKRRRVREVLAGLRERDAQLLLLRAEGLAYRELAESLGIQPGSVGTLLARAEAEFERKFRARYGEEV